MDFLDKLDEMADVKPATAQGGPIEKGNQIGVISGASVENNEKFGIVVSLELTLQNRRKVWTPYYLEGEWKDSNTANLRAQFVAVGVDPTYKGSELPDRLEQLKGRTVDAYIGLKKNGKNYFSINKEVDAALAESTLDVLEPEPSFDSSEEIPF